jgi:DNA-binding MarR family transcriptional regulator
MSKPDERSTTAVTPLEQRISYRCSLISARIARFLSPMWESRYGLTVDSWRILAIIGRFGPLSAKDVATRTSTDAFHVSRAIERLTRKKLIKREVDPNDRRRARIQLTAAGQSVHVAVQRVLTRLENELLDGLGERERAALQHGLATLDERALALMASGLTWKDFA